MHRASLFDLVNSQHLFLIVHFVHFCLNPIASANVAAHLSGLIDMQEHFLTVKPLDDIVTAFNAHHLALDGLDALPKFLIALQEVGKSALPISTGVMSHSLCCLRGIRQTQAQYGTTRDDTDDFWNG